MPSPRSGTTLVDGIVVDGLLHQTLPVEARRRRVPGSGERRRFGREETREAVHRGGATRRDEVELGKGRGVGIV